MTEAEALEIMSAIVAEETEAGELRLERSMVAEDVAGWDSVTHSRIMIQLEQRFEIEIPVDRIYAFANVGELVDLLLGQHSGKAPQRASGE
jgi:acyl carrier protein